MSGGTVPTRDHTPTMTTRRSLLGLAVFGLAVLAASGIGGLGSQQAGEVYGQLQLPNWAPPQWLFSPVWLALYVFIAISGWLVWRQAGWNGTKIALSLFALQLVLNAAWSPLFFAAGWRGVAFVDIAALLVVLTALIIVFARHSRIAAGLLVPYWAWVTFAAALNLSIWQLNT